jgi:heme oxygenase
MTVTPQPADAGRAQRAEGGRRFRLKAATRIAHERVEEIVGAAGMFADIEGYRRYVVATYAARADIERELDAGGAQRLFPAWPRRRLTALIAADLADLGMQAPARLRETTRRGTGAGPSAPDLLGQLYVLEGSSLGAQILVRSADSLGVSATFGARHLHRQAGETGAWRAFCDVLEGADLSAAEESRMFAAAERTFDRFANAYARHAG